MIGKQVQKEKYYRKGDFSDSKNIRNDFGLCEDSQSLPACPSDKNSINLLNLAVSLRTTRFNTQKLWIVFALHFVWISEQTTTFALYVIHWLVFITVVESV